MNLRNQGSSSATTNNHQPTINHQPLTLSPYLSISSRLMILRY